MAITYRLPQTARYHSIGLTFSAPFSGGVYRFASEGTPVLRLEKNSVVLIERLFVGADFPEDVYLEAINTLPQLTFRRLQDGEMVYPRPLQIVHFIDGKEIGAWVFSDKSNDFLIADLTGLLNQVPALVGKDPIRIFCSLSIYTVDHNAYATWYHSAIPAGSPGARGL